MDFSPEDFGLTRELAARIIVPDPSIGGRCRRCTYRIGLYTFTVGWFSQCPGCLKDRIEAVAADGVPLEQELEFTYISVIKELRLQKERMFGKLTVEMPRFFECARCGKLERHERGCSPAPGSDGEGPKIRYCMDCYDPSGGHIVS